MVPSINIRWGGVKRMGKWSDHKEGGGSYFQCDVRKAAKKVIFLMVLRGRGIRTCHKIGLGSD